MFDRIQMRRLWRPLQYVDFGFLEEVLCVFGGVNWGIVLLKDHFTFWKVFQERYEVRFEYLHIVHSLHSVVNPDDWRNT